jgi:hypothetical protein
MKARISVKSWRAAACWLAVLLLTATGCGPGRGSATGKVTYSGKPLVYGSVVFLGADGLPVSGAIGTDGSYTANNILEGENHVTIYSINPALAVPVDREGKPRGKPEVDPKLWFPIPDKYIDPQKSGLVFTIKRNTSNPIDIALK